MSLAHDQGLIDAWEQSLQPLLDSISEFGGPFLVGEEMTLADCAIAPFLGRFVLIASEFRGYDARRGLPELGDYLRALEEEPSGAWSQTFPPVDLYSQALEQYGCLDYYHLHSATLLEPRPWCLGFLEGGGPQQMKPPWQRWGHSADVLEDGPFPDMLEGPRSPGGTPGERPPVDEDDDDGLLPSQIGGDGITIGESLEDPGGRAYTDKEENVFGLPIAPEDAVNMPELKGPPREPPPTGTLNLPGNVKPRPRPQVGGGHAAPPSTGAELRDRPPEDWPGSPETNPNNRFGPQSDEALIQAKRDMWEQGRQRSSDIAQPRPDPYIHGVTPPVVPGGLEDPPFEQPSQPEPPAVYEPALNPPPLLEPPPTYGGARAYGGASAPVPTAPVPTAPVPTAPVQSAPVQETRQETPSLTAPEPPQPPPERERRRRSAPSRRPIIGQPSQPQPSQMQPPQMQPPPIQQQPQYEPPQYKPPLHQEQPSHREPPNGQLPHEQPPQQRARQQRLRPPPRSQSSDQPTQPQPPTSQRPVGEAELRHPFGNAPLPLPASWLGHQPQRSEPNGAGEEPKPKPPPPPKRIYMPTVNDFMGNPHGRRARRTLSSAGSALASPGSQLQCGLEPPAWVAVNRYMSGWRRVLHSWWAALTGGEAASLGACMYALGLHLASRFDLLLNAWRASAGLPPVAPRSGPLAPGANGAGALPGAEGGCEHVGERATELGLPEMPSFPPDATPFHLPALPPIPRLLPSEHFLRSRHRDDPQLLASLLDALANPAVQVAGGGLIGVEVGLSGRLNLPEAADDKRKGAFKARHMGFGAQVGLGAVAGGAAAAALALGAVLVVRTRRCRRGGGTQGGGSRHSGGGGLLAPGTPLRPLPGRAALRHTSK